MKRILLGVVAALAMGSFASAQEIISYRAPDGTNRIDVSAATPLPVQSVAITPGATPVPAGSVPAGAVSVGNSTSTPLGSSAVFTGAWEDVSAYADVRIAVFSNQGSAVDGLSVQTSSDGVNADNTDVYTVLGNSGKLLSFGTGARYMRVVYTNGVTGQTTFRLQTVYKANHPKSSSVRPQDGRSNDNDMEEMLAYGMIWDQGNGAWQRQRGDTNGTTVQGSRATSTVVAGTTSGTISTFTTALASSAARRGCMVVNKSTNPLFLSLSASPTTANSVILAAGSATADGGIFNCANPGGLIVTDTISVSSGTASQAYLVMSQ